MTVSPISDLSLPPSLAAVPNIPPREQTLDQLLAEKAYWEARLSAKSGWGAAVGAMSEIIQELETHIQIRRLAGKQPTRSLPLLPKTAYVAAPFDNQRVAVLAAADMAAHGWEITSTWLTAKLANMTNRDECVQAAKADLADVKRARVLVVLTDPRPIGAGHHVELGYFRAWREIEKERQIVVVGPHKSVFHWLADLYYPTWEVAKDQVWLTNDLKLR